MPDFMIILILYTDLLNPFLDKKKMSVFEEYGAFSLTLSTLGNHFSRRHFEYIFFFLFSQKTGFDFSSNLHEMSKLIFWKKNIIDLSSAEIAKRKGKVNHMLLPK